MPVGKVLIANLHLTGILWAAAQLIAAPGAEARDMPATVEDAKVQFDTRKEHLINWWVKDLEQNGIGNWEADGSKRSVRRIASRLIKDPSFAGEAQTWSAAIHKYTYAGTGTCPPWESCGDFDMDMRELISLLYYFKNDSYRLTNEAAYNIVHNGLISYTGPVTDKMVFTVAGISFPETENHVLMIESSRYLTNQWIRQNPRNDARLRTGVYADQARFINDGSQVEDMLLQAMGRIVYSDFWETNARAYQALSVHALMNLYSFAESPKIRLAAKNALDYAATKFAFQSFEGKRWAPHRRNNEYTHRLGMFESDPLILVMGALSGAYRWEDDPARSDCFYNNGALQNGTGLALWATLLDYRLPESVHDFMLSKRQGYWARMQSRHYEGGNNVDGEYNTSKWPRYFNANGTIFANPGFMVKAPEFYFATPDYMNVSGGWFTRYKNLTGNVYNEVDGYDFLPRPNIVITKGHWRNWDSGMWSELGTWKENLTQFAQDALNMRGHRQWWKGNNSATYKSFTYGYFHNPDDGTGDRHLEYPMMVPASWEAYRYKEGTKADFTNTSSSRATFKFYDLSNVPDKGFYLVCGRVSKSRNETKYRNYARGFWELVPKSRFPNGIASLKSWVMANNPDAQYTDGTSGDSKWYRYRMTSGELIKLNILIGFEDGNCVNPILGVYNASGTEIPLEDAVYRACGSDASKGYTSPMVLNVPKYWETLPLIDVRELYPASNGETGRKLAWSSGNGHVSVNNPYRLSAVSLDSRVYYNPARSEVEYGLLNALSANAPDFLDKTNWSIDTDTYTSGVSSAVSGKLRDNERTYFEIQMNCSQVQFDVRTSTEASYDKFRFYVDGVLWYTQDGETAWTSRTFPVPSGNHTFRWEYSKDYSVSSGQDQVWLDRIVFN